jgi:5-methylcytosine-specific restriction protein B
LLNGVGLLRRLPANGSDDDYKQLQEDLDRDAPDVSALSWGHKYFNLAFPDKLDELHLPELQRFHLLKMLQSPPEGKGRYICAGRFVSATSELDIPMNSLMAVLYAVNGKKHRYWRIGTSDSTAPRNRWPLMKDGKCVAIGWEKVGDLSTLEATKDSREHLQNLLAEKHPAVPSIVGRTRSQIMNFVTAIAEGDLVLASDGATVLGIGHVTGDYAFVGTSDFPHRPPSSGCRSMSGRCPAPRVCGPRFTRLRRERTS